MKASKAINSPYEVLKGIKFGGRFQYAVSTTAFAYLSGTCSNLDDRSAAVSELYSNWRMRGLRVTVMARETTMVHLAIWFNQPGTGATTIEELNDCPHYSCGSGLYGSPLPSLYITKRDLDKYRQIAWYNTGLSTPDNEFEYQFVLYSYAPFATLNYYVLLEYDIEYNAPCDPTTSLTMDWRERQRLAREKSSKGIIWPSPRPRKADETKLDEGAPLDDDIVLGAVVVDPVPGVRALAGTRSPMSSCPGVPQQRKPAAGNARK